MSALRVILEIIILICYFTVVLSSEDLRQTSMMITIPQDDPSQYSVRSIFFEIDDNPSIYYATCKNTSDDVYTCTVVRETPLNSQASLKAIRSCKNIRLNLSDLNKDDRKVQGIFPMTDGYVALVHSYQGQTTRFTLVNVMHCNKPIVVIKKLPLTNNSVRDRMSLSIWPVVYKHSLELMVQNDPGCATSESTTCLVKYNYAGEKLGARSLKLRSSTLLHNVRDGEDKGLYSFNIGSGWGKRLNISHVAPNGEVRLIAEDVYSSMDLNFGRSYAHGLFSICWEVNWPNVSLRCLQVDREKVLVNVTLSTKILDWRPQWYMVHNMPGGGMLLASGNNTIGPSFQVRRLTNDTRDADWWLDVQTNQETYKCDKELGLWTRVMEDKENEEVCFHFACENKENSGWKIKYEKVCVPERLVMGSLKKKYVV